MNAHPVVMFEFIARQRDQLCQFYADVFGWSYEVDDGFACINFPEPPGTTLGGIGQARVGVPGWSPGRSFYLVTEDVEATLHRVVAAGGAVHVPTTETDGYRFAMFTDPEGNVVGLLQVHLQH
jgi:predicted enzyme related to lactoylglutathione lyase